MNLMTRRKSSNVKYRIPEHVEWSLINTIKKMLSLICKRSGGFSSYRYDVEHIHSKNNGMKFIPK